MHLYYFPVSLLVLIVSFWLFQKASGSMSLRSLNIVSWVFYYGLILQSFIGINLAYVFDVEHYLIAKTSENHLQMAYWSINYTLIAMPISMIAIQKLVWGGKIKSKLSSYFAAQIRPLQSKRDSSLLLFWVSMSIVAALSTVYVYAVVKSAPFIALFSSGTSSLEFAQLRIEAGRGFSGNVYVRSLFSLLLSPFVSYVAYAYKALYPKDFRFQIWFTITFVVAVFAVTSDGQKAPILNYLLGLFFIRGYIRGGFSLGKLILAGTIISALVFLLYFLTSENVSIGLASGPIGRIILSSVAGLPLHFMIFPSIIPFLGGASFPGWIAGSLFGVEHVRSARVVMEVINPAGVASGTAGVINTLFIGEAWANFGWMGLIVAPFVVGFVIQSIYNILLALPKTPVFLAAVGFFMVNMVVTGGFVDFVWNVAWMTLAIWLFLSILPRRFLLISRHNRHQRFKSTSSLDSISTISSSIISGEQRT